MMLMQAIANDVAVAMDAAGGRVPSAIQLHSTLEKVLRDEINGLRERAGLKPVPDDEPLLVMGIRMIKWDKAPPWEIVP